MRLGLTFLLTALLHAQQSQLKIVVLEGQDASNNINQPIAREPVIQVQDESGMPVQGASVTFLLPAQGPSATFGNGTNTLTTTTDRDGRAVARGIRFNHQTGKFQIRVAASYRGQIASAVIDQTNVYGISTSNPGPSKKLLVILALAGGAAAAGIFAATHGGGSSGSSSPPIVLMPGTPTVGGPH